MGKERDRTLRAIAVGPCVGSALVLALVLALALRFGHWHRPELLSPSTSTPPVPPALRVVAPPKAAEPRPDSAPEQSALGRKIFFDSSLSEPRGMSCATCHDPAHGFAGNNGSRLGVALGSRPGHFAERNTPSVLYLKFVRRFHLHWEEDAPVVDAYGGFFWDGRVDSIRELVKQPLQNPNEMNAGSAQNVANKLRASAYAAELSRTFPHWDESAEAALGALGEALESYLNSPEMAPFSSKYDHFIRHELTLSALEARGLALFKDSAKGGCSSCHKLNDTLPIPERSLFTDYGYEAVAVPRNRSLPENRNAAHFDLGLCKRPDTHYHTDGAEFCGSFRTPSLRNVAVRSSFMHNGVFSSLRQVVEFYATRATDPKHWYEAGTFDDLPEPYRQNVNVDKAPYNRHEGEAPPLRASEIDALVAFLGTLTDAEFQKAPASER
jgi:cytochrome c peroxidase